MDSLFGFLVEKQLVLLIALQISPGFESLERVVFCLKIRSLFPLPPSCICSCVPCAIQLRFLVATNTIFRVLVTTEVRMVTVIVFIDRDSLPYVTRIWVTMNDGCGSRLVIITSSVSLRYGRIITSTSTASGAYIPFVT